MTITSRDLRDLHNAYQEAYAQACYHQRLAEAELRHKAGLVHRDGRPVTLVNPGGDWERVERLRHELEAARAEHRAANPGEYEIPAGKLAEQAAAANQLRADRLTNPPIGWGSSLYPYPPHRREAWQRLPVWIRLSDPRSRARF